MMIPWLSSAWRPLSSSLLVLCAFQGMASAPDVTQLTFVTPLQFGARPNDRVDDTRAFQDAVNAAARAGKQVRVPAGTYLIDANANPGWGAFGGVRLPSNTRLHLEAGAILQARPSASSQSSVLRIEDVQNVVVEGQGTIRGERHTHRGSGGEWGMGIFIRGARRVQIRDVRIEDCWGDAIYVARSDRGYSEDIEIHRIRANGNRRQGISVVSARRVLIADVDIRNTRGTPPSAGIDLEPDTPDAPNESITIRGGYFAGNAQDILMVVGNRNVLVDGPRLRSQLGVVVRDGSSSVRILNADIHASDTRAGTGAIKVIAHDASTIRGLEISRNRLRGGEIVLDIPYAQVQGVQIRQNQIQRDRPGQRAHRVNARGAQWSGNTVRE